MLVSMIGGVVTAGHVGIATLSDGSGCSRCGVCTKHQVLHSVCVPEMDLNVYGLYET